MKLIIQTVPNYYRKVSSKIGFDGVCESRASWWQGFSSSSDWGSLGLFLDITWVNADQLCSGLKVCWHTECIPGAHRLVWLDQRQIQFTSSVSVRQWEAKLGKEGQLGDSLQKHISDPNEIANTHSWGVQFSLQILECISMPDC